MFFEDERRFTLSLSEAARLAGVSVPVLSSWTRLEGFPAFRAGRRWIIPAAAFEAWLEERARKQLDVPGVR